MTESCSHVNPEWANSYFENPPNRLLNRFFELNSGKIQWRKSPLRVQIDPEKKETYSCVTVLLWCRRQFSPEMSQLSGKITVSWACSTHLFPFSKSKFNLAIWNIKSDHVNLVAPASPVYRARYSTNWDRKSWPGSEIQMNYSCPWQDTAVLNRLYK